MKNQTIAERIEMTLANIYFQEQVQSEACGKKVGATHWDDIEKLENCLELLKRGCRLDDEFRFVEVL